MKRWSIFSSECWQKEHSPLTFSPIFLSSRRVESFCLINFQANNLILGSKFRRQIVFNILALGWYWICKLLTQVILLTENSPVVMNFHSILSSMLELELEWLLNDINRMNLKKRVSISLFCMVIKLLIFAFWLIRRAVLRLISYLKENLWYWFYQKFLTIS